MVTMTLPLLRPTSVLRGLTSQTAAPRAEVASEVLAAADSKLAQLSPEERHSPFGFSEADVRNLWYAQGATVNVKPKRFVDPLSPRVADVLDAVAAGGRLYAKAGEVTASLTL